MLKQDKKYRRAQNQTANRYLLEIERARAMPAEVASQHHGGRYFYKLRRLKLTYSGNPDPRALAVYLQTNSRNENYHQQQKAEDVKRRGDVYQLAVVIEGNQQHRHYGNPQPDELFHPVVFGWLRITNLDRTKAHDANRHQRQQPVEVAETPFLNYCYHK